MAQICHAEFVNTKVVMLKSFYYKHRFINTCTCLNFYAATTIWKESLLNKTSNGTVNVISKYKLSEKCEEEI